MANKQFYLYKKVIGSFETAESFNGILPSGRYRGFDTLVGLPGTGINYKITHDLTGFIKTQQDGTLTVPNGVLVSSQGQVLHIDEDINIINHSPNNSSNPRWDILFCQYAYVKNTQGSIISFGIQKGTEDSLPPEFEQISSNSRIPVAFIEVTANTTSFSSDGVKIYPISGKPLSGLGYKSKFLTIVKTGSTDESDIIIVDKEVGLINYTRDVNGDSSSRVQNIFLPKIKIEDYGRPIYLNLNITSEANNDVTLTLKDVGGATVRSWNATGNNSQIKSVMFIPTISGYTYVELSSDTSSDIQDLRTRMGQMGQQVSSFNNTVQAINLGLASIDQHISDTDNALGEVQNSIIFINEALDSQNVINTNVNTALGVRYTKTETNALLPKDIGDSGPSGAYNYGPSMVNGGILTDIDLTGKVPPNRIAIFYYDCLVTAGNGGGFMVKKKGDTNRVFNHVVSPPIPNASHLYGTLLVFTDSNCKIQYSIGSGNSVPTFNLIGYI